MNTAEPIETVVVGAGHAGLAVSRLLSDADREHVVLERGRLAESWRSERWDSLHLLTPAWMTRHPGRRYLGQQERFLSVEELVGYLEEYATSFDAPVAEDVTVLEVTRPDENFRVVTDSGTFTARHVVVATGPSGRPRLPEGVDPSLLVASSAYRNPGALPAGRVLVVGASSSGVQIADELSRAGREVTLAVGSHTRVPRSYRGMDLFWWLETTGRLARTVDDVADVDAARRESSLQLVGRNPSYGAEQLDLVALQRQGVRLAGRMASVTDSVARFGDGLVEEVAAADARLRRLLDSLDAYATRYGLDAELLPPRRPEPIAVATTPDRVDLRTEGFGAVVAATGFRPDHSWLRVPGAVGDAGSIAQYRGVTPVPGLYVVGQRFQHRRDSSFIDGARFDARDVVAHLLRGSYPDSPVRPAERSRYGGAS